MMDSAPTQQSYFQQVATESATVFLELRPYVGPSGEIRVRVQGHPEPWRLGFAEPRLPSLAVFRDGVVLWVSANAGVIDLLKGEGREHRLPEEVVAVFRCGKGWCLLCEATLFAFDTLAGFPGFRFGLPEVVEDYFVAGHRVVIQCMDGSRLDLEISFGPASIQQVAGPSAGGSWSARP